MINICYICKKNEGTIKNSTHYFKNIGKKIYYTCNPCNTERAKKYRKKPEKMKSIYKNTIVKYIEKNREKSRAWTRVYMAIKDGTLVKPGKCSKCNKECIVDAHHEDYLKPLEIIWLCRDCHCKLR